MTRFNATSTTDGIKDGTSAIHTGIVKVLEQAARGNHIVEYGNLQQTAGSTYTQFGFDGAVSFLRDGLKVSASPSAIELPAAPDGTHDRYDMLVITVAGPNNLAFRQGEAAVAPRVLDTNPFVTGDIPVALVKVDGGSTNNTTGREIQQYGYNKDTNAVSIAWNGGGTTYTETSSIVGSSNTTTWTAASGSDIKIKLAGTASGDTFEVIDSASQIQFKVQGDGVVTTEGDTTVGGDLTVSGGDIIGPTDGDLLIKSDGNLTFRIDADNDETSQSFAFQNNASTEIAALTEGGDLQIDGDLTVSGGDITYGNGQNATLGVTATAHNTAGKPIAITAGTTTAGTTNNIAGGSLTLKGGQGKGSGAGGDIIFQTANAGGSGSALNAHATALTISDDLNATFAGDITVSGNDLTFGNGATIVNTSSSLLTVTEATTTFSAAVTAGTSVDAPTITASTQLTTSNRLSRGGEQTIDSAAAFPAATPLTYKSVQLLDTILAPTNYFVLPAATGQASAIITLKNLGVTTAEIERMPGEEIEGGGTQSSLITTPNIISLPSMAHVTLMSFDDGIINQAALGATVAAGCVFGIGWVIIGQGL
jgi:hypothetical protein